MEKQRLKEKHAVVTGGGTGIGAAVAAALVADGARVTVMDRRLKPLEATATTLDKARCLCCDVTDSDSVRAAFAGARDHCAGHEQPQVERVDGTRRARAD